MKIKDLDLPAIDLERLVSVELASAYTKACGYDFDAIRTERIAAGARFAMSVGAPAWFAFDHALDTELLMHGDPKAPVYNLNGLEGGR